MRTKDNVKKERIVLRNSQLYQRDFDGLEDMFQPLERQLVQFDRIR